MRKGTPIWTGMKPYVKSYMDHYGIGEQDYITCRACLGRRAVDIHHIKFRSLGGTDEISNLIALCRYCHDKAHNDREFNAKLKLRHG